MINVSEIFWAPWVKELIDDMLDDKNIDLSGLDTMVSHIEEKIKNILSEMNTIPKVADKDKIILSKAIAKKYPNNELVLSANKQEENNKRFQNIYIEKIRLQNSKSTIVYFKKLLSNILLDSENKEQKLCIFFDGITPAYRDIIEKTSALQSSIIHEIANHNWLDLKDLTEKTWIKKSSLSPLLWRLMEKQIIQKDNGQYKINTELLPSFVEWYQRRYNSRRFQKTYEQ